MYTMRKSQRISAGAHKQGFMAHLRSMNAILHHCKLQQFHFTRPILWGSFLLYLAPRLLLSCFFVLKFAHFLRLSLMTACSSPQLEGMTLYQKLWWSKTFSSLGCYLAPLTSSVHQSVMQSFSYG